MATVTALRAGTNYVPRSQEKGVFCEVSTYEASATAAATVIQMIKVQSGTTILGGRVLSDDLSNSENTTIAVGDGNSTTRFLTTTDAHSAAVDTVITGFPYTYSSDDTIDVVIGTGAATGTITLVVYMTREAVDLTGS